MLPARYPNKDNPSSCHGSDLAGIFDQYYAARQMLAAAEVVAGSIPIVSMFSSPYADYKVRKTPPHFPKSSARPVHAGSHDQRSYHPWPHNTDR